MTMWFLIIILTGGDVEQHVAVEMPNQTTCETIAQGYVHVANYPAIDPMNVDEVLCEETDDE